MSSIQDRIRRLQSADATHTPPIQHLTHQAGTQSTAPKLEQRAAQFQKSQSDDTGPGLARRVAALEASAEAGKLGERIRRMEMEGSRGRVGVRGEGLDVNDRAMLFERSVGGGEEGRSFGGGDGGVLGRASVFEEGSGTGGGVLDKAGVFGRMESEGTADGGGGLLEKRGVFERESSEVGKAEDDGIGAGALKKAEEPEGSGSGSGKGGSVPKKAGVFEEGEPSFTKGSTSDGNSGNLLTKARMFDKDVKKEKGGSQVGLSNRAAIFERGADKLQKKDKVTECAETTGAEGGLAQELREVKLINKMLVERLVDLSGAFKRLEQSREQLQQRIQRLEKK